jgi:hypothetical protein
MDALTALVLSQLVLHRPPGKSPYSMEAMDECGLNPAAAECELERVCKEPVFWCAKPRWSKARNAWVRVETRATGLTRYAEFADTVVRTVRRLTRCVDEEGVAMEDCQRVRWWRGSQDLSLVVATIAIFESGMAEGPMYGHPPLGIGADGEVCMMGLMPQYAPPFARWLPEEERTRLFKAPHREIRSWAMAELQGPTNIGRCLEVSIRELARHRRVCKSDYGMFSAYAAGHCRSWAKTIRLRVKLLDRMRRSKPELPAWARVQLGSSAPA